MKYNAFISYRHTPLDLKVAKKLHKALETFRIPASVRKKTGKKRIERVFRDQEELPIGSDLNENILNALTESEYLIVVCSPNTPQSEWVAKEIETFIRLHDRNHVLAILIDGKPEESFPGLLITDEEGNNVEPLAADIRGNSSHERDKKFKTELLRLAAPLIGCTYDDLKQRHKERIIKRNLSIGSAIAASIIIVAVAFGIYNARVANKMEKLADEKTKLADEKTELADKILEEYREKQVNQSRFYAKESAELLKKGRKEDAILVAMEGLPVTGGERPYVPEAEFALGNALSAYGDNEYPVVLKTLYQDYKNNMLLESEDGSHIISVDQDYNYYFWDASNGTLLGKMPSTFYPWKVKCDKGRVFILTFDRIMVYDYSGNQIGQLTEEDVEKAISEILDDYIPFNFSSCDINLSGGQAVVTNGECIAIIDITSLEVIRAFLLDDRYSINEIKIYPESDSILFVSGLFSAESGKNDYYIWNMNTETGETKKYHIPYKINNIQNHLYMNPNEEVIASVTDETNFEHILVISKDGTLKWESILDNTPNFGGWGENFYYYSYTSEDGEKSQIIVPIDSDVYLLDAQTGETEHVINHAYSFTGAYLNEKNNNRALFYYQNGDICTVYLDKGKIEPKLTISTGVTSNRIIRSNDLYYISESGTSSIMLVGRVSALKSEKMTNVKNGSFLGADLMKNIFAVSEYDSHNILFYDCNGKLLDSYETDRGINDRSCAFYNDSLYAFDDDCLIILNPYTKTHIMKEYSELGIEKIINTYTIYLSHDFSYCILHDYNDLLFLIDLKNWRLQKSISDTGRFFAVTDDGKKLFYISEDNKLKILDTEKNQSVISKDYEFLVSNESGVMEISKDENRLAVLCDDNTVRILDLSDYTVTDEVKIDYHEDCSLHFTEDGNTLIIQDSNNKVLFYNLSVHSIISTLDCSSKISCITEDEEDNLIAIQEQYSLYLLTNDDYSPVAYIPRGTSYFPDKNLIIRKEFWFGHDFYSVPYKDYKELIDEANILFPGIALSEEKKREYNIE